MEWDTSIEFSPLVLLFEGKRERVIVRTVQEAANTLIKNWPSDDGEEFLAAIKACLDVMTGNADPEDLRAAVMRAADEAGVTVIAALH